MYRRLISLLVVVGMLAGLFSPVIFNAAQPASANAPQNSAQADGFVLTLLHTNDVHARVDEFRSNGTRCTEAHAEDGLCIGGVARLATVVNEIRADKENVLLLDAGDQFQGTLFFTLFGADVLTDTMTALGYDAMAIGNHEFDSGPAELARFIDGVDFPVLGTNIDVAAGCVLEGKILPTAIITRSGEPIGLIGLVTPDTENISSPGPNVSFTAPITAAQAAVDTLTAQGVNKIIALTHMGYGYDLELAEAVAGIDVIIGGHSHTFLYTPDDEPVNFISPTLTLNPVGPYPTVVQSPAEEPVLVVSAYQWGIMLGALDVTFDAAGIVTTWKGNPIYIGAEVEKDADMETLLDKYRPAVEELITTPIGEVGVDLLINVDGQQICRLGECLMGNLVADAMLWMANEIAPEGNYQIAFQNGGGLRAALNTGEVTMGDVMEVLPFGNVITLFQLKGEYVIAALENGMSRYPAANGGFAQVSGLRYQFDASKPVNSRITRVEVWNGEAYEPLNPDAIYNIVTNDFMGRGGDNYGMFSEHAIDLYNTSLGLDAAVAEYIEASSPVTPAIEGRVEIIAPDLSESDKKVVDADGDGKASAGEILTYTIMIENTGTDNAAFWLTDTLPSGVTYIQNSLYYNGFPDSATITITNGVLVAKTTDFPLRPDGGSLTIRMPGMIRFAVTVDEPLPPGNALVNQIQLQDQVRTYNIAPAVIPLSRNTIFLPLVMRAYPAP